MSAPPWMKLNVAHFAADTLHLSTQEIGAYVLLTLHYWQHAGLPSEDERLARIAKMSLEEWQCVRNALAMLFIDNWRHKRVDQELTKAIVKSTKASMSANKRWKEKKKRDNAKASRTHMPTQSQRNDNKTFKKESLYDQPEAGFKPLASALGALEGAIRGRKPLA